ncbi:MAG: hypothetical protein AB7J35_06975 [Dehalococcoidia bacterium]
MAFRASALAFLAAALLLTACDQGRNYPTNLGDGDYNLEAMALTQADLPAGFTQGDGFEFTSDEWAQLYDTDDTEATVRQLEAQGWLRNWVTEAVPDGFGRVLNIRSISTLYTDEAAAQESTEKFACGLPVSLSVPLEPFIVSKIGEQTNGFFVDEDIDSAGTKLTYTTVCFRTGRIVHVVQEGSLPGLEDIADSLRTANTMLKHVNAAYDNPVKADDGG